MKKMVLGVFLFASILNSMASTLECFDKKTKHSVLLLADDHGHVSAGGLVMPNNEVYSFEKLVSDKGYSYYYGEYLLISDVINNARVEIVAVRTKSRGLEGKVSVRTVQGEEKVFLNIICKE